MSKNAIFCQIRKPANLEIFPKIQLATKLVTICMTNVKVCRRYFVTSTQKRQKLRFVRSVKCALKRDPFTRTATILNAVVQKIGYYGMARGPTFRLYNFGEFDFYIL